MSLTKKLFAVAAILGFAITTTAATNSTATTVGDNAPKSFMDNFGMTAYIFAYDANLDEIADDSAGSSDSIYGRLLGKYKLSKDWSVRAGFNYSYNFDEAKEEQLEDPILEARWSGTLGRAKVLSYLRSYIGLSDASKDADRQAVLRHLTAFTLPTTISPDLKATLWTRAQGYIYGDDAANAGTEYQLRVYPGFNYKINKTFSAFTYSQFSWSSDRSDSTFNRSDEVRQYAGVTTSLGKLTIEAYAGMSLFDSQTENTDFEIDFIYSLL